MREITVEQRVCATENGRTVLYERKYHGLLREDGSFRLLACCGKRFPLPRHSAGLSERAAKQRREAA